MLITPDVILYFGRNIGEILAMDPEVTWKKRCGLKVELAIRTFLG